MDPVILKLVLLAQASVCLAYVTVIPTTGLKTFQVSGRNTWYMKEIKEINIGNKTYKECPELRFLLEGIGLGYLMLEEFPIANKEKIKFGVNGRILYDFEKPVSVSFLGKCEKGMNGLISFLVRLLEGKEQIIFFLSRDATNEELKDDWAREIAAAIFRDSAVGTTLGCTKSEFITAVTEIIVDPTNVEGAMLARAIKEKIPKILEDPVLNVVTERNKREKISKNIINQFTSLLGMVENKLGVRVIREPNPESDRTEYDKAMAFLGEFKIISLIGDDLAGIWRIGDPVKRNAIRSLNLMRKLSGLQNKNNHPTKPTVWAAGNQSFHSNTTTPSNTIWDMMGFYEKQSFVHNMDLPVTPDYTTVIGIFTGEEKESSSTKYSICQPGPIADFIESRMNALNANPSMGPKNFLYAVPRALSADGWERIYDEKWFDYFKNVILLKIGDIKITIGEVKNGQVENSEEIPG